MYLYNARISTGDVKKTYLKYLKSFIEFCFACTTRWGHSNCRRNGGNAPPEFITGQHSEFISMGWSQVVDYIIFMTDIISQINPIDISIWKIKNNIKFPNILIFFFVSISEYKNLNSFWYKCMYLCLLWKNHLLMYRK